MVGPETGTIKEYIVKFLQFQERTFQGHNSKNLKVFSKRKKGIFIVINKY